MRTDPPTLRRRTTGEPWANAERNVGIAQHGPNTSADRLEAMSVAPGPVRSTSFGEGHRLSVVDRFGTWLSQRAMHGAVGSIDGLVVADIGCGHTARFGLAVLPRVERLLLADVSLDPSICGLTKVVTAIGPLPSSLADLESGSVHAVVMNSVLEHLDEPVATLSELRRLADPHRGIVFVNVPSWLGKRALEASAFRFGLSPRLEIEDHRRYYSTRQLWQHLRDAGFLPSEIRVRTHKFGLNVYAVCRMQRGVHGGSA